MRPLVLILAALAACDGATTDTDPDTDTDVASLDVFDPLSMPREPTHDLASFSSAQECAGCHPSHVAQWSTSIHAYAMTDPVFRRLAAARQADFEGHQGQFCTQCHSPIGTRGGDMPTGFTFEQLAPITLEGVTCETCHKISEVRRPNNNGLVLDPDGPLRATIEDPVDNVFHASAYSELHGDALLCGSCHDVIETSGLDLERPYAEWLESPAGAEGRPCQSCHMPASTGPAALDGPDREVHDHRFYGVDIPLAEGFLTDEQEEEVRAAVKSLLADAATLALDAPAVSREGDQIDVVVTVHNDIDAHAFPTGSTFNRQVWLELIARDATGRVLYETGTLDEQGDLRNYWSELDPFGDEDLIQLSSGLTDLFGDPEIYTWRALEHTSPAISPLYERTWTLFVPTDALVVSPITVDARLLFRQLPPFLLREVGLDALVERLEIHEVSTASLDVELVP